MRQFIKCLETERTKAIRIAGMEGYIEGKDEKAGSYRVIVYDLVGPCGPFDLGVGDFAHIEKEDFLALRMRKKY